MYVLHRQCNVHDDPFMSLNTGMSTEIFFLIVPDLVGILANDHYIYLPIQFIFPICPGWPSGQGSW